MHNMKKYVFLMMVILIVLSSTLISASTLESRTWGGGTIMLGNKLVANIKPKTNCLYAFYLYKDNVCVYKGGYSNSTRFEYTPKATGNYKIKLYYRFSNGTRFSIYSRLYKVISYEPLKLTCSQLPSELELGKNLSIQMSANGGNPSYQYAYYIYKNNLAIYKSKYSTKSSFAYLPKEVGEYKFVCFVKDKNYNKKIVTSNAVHVKHPRVYRALLVAQENYEDITLSGPFKNLESIKALLQNRPGTKNITELKDCDGESLLNAIPKAFAGANESSVSIFYFSGRGVRNSIIVENQVVYLPKHGALDCMDYTIVYGQELATELNKIPGEIIVLLDSDFSGSYINSYARNNNNAFINIFKTFNKRNGELMSNKFHVITATHIAEKFSNQNLYKGFMTTGIINAKDSDNNGYISMYEAFESAKNYAFVSSNGEQSVQCYPQNDSLMLFK